MPKEFFLKAFYELTEGNQVANSKFEISLNATNE